MTPKGWKEKTPSLLNFITVLRIIYLSRLRREIFQILTNQTNQTNCYGEKNKDLSDLNWFVWFLPVRALLEIIRWINSHTLLFVKKCSKWVCQKWMSALRTSTNGSLRRRLKKGVRFAQKSLKSFQIIQTLNLKSFQIIQTLNLKSQTLTKELPLLAIWDFFTFVPKVFTNKA